MFEQVTHLQVVPPILVALCKSPLVNSDTLSGVRLIKNGAAPMSAELEQMIRSKLAKDVIFRHSKAYHNIHLYELMFIYSLLLLLLG